MLVTFGYSSSCAASCIVDVNNQCAPILTAMVYVWHCDKDCDYSGYTRPKGRNPTLPTNDGIFSDGVAYQMCTVTENAVTGGYKAELTVGIAA